MPRRIIKAPDSIALHDAFGESGQHSKTFPPYTKNYEKPVYDERSHWTTSFTSWVFEADRKKKKKREIDEIETVRLYEEGKTAENAIEELKYWANENSPGSGIEIWEKLFVDNKDVKHQPSFLASCLKINGQPIVCRPDVVLKEKDKNNICIIERKYTNVSLEYINPSKWPNLYTQLWCYSWIDDWLDYDNIYLIGQIWIKDYTENYDSMGEHISNNLTFEQTTFYPRWKRTNQKLEEPFHTNCLQWFELYGGTFTDPYK